jgi:hypothetical protein
LRRSLVAVVAAVAITVMATGCGKHLNLEWCKDHLEDPDCAIAGMDASIFGSADGPTDGSIGGSIDGSIDGAPDSSVDGPQDGGSNGPPACVSDSECPDTLCLPEGVCAPPRASLHAVALQGTGTTCSADVPCTLASALAAVTSERNIILLGPGAYTGGIVLDRQVRIAGRDATLQGPASGAAVTVASNGNTVADAELDYLSISGAHASAISCTSGTLRVRGVTIVGNQLGITSGCALTVERSVIRDNSDGALAIMAGSIEIHNNFIYGNGGGAPNKTANVVIELAATGAFTFNTVTHNDAKNNSTPGVACDGSGVDMEGNLITENKTKGAFTGDQISGSCNFKHSYTTAGADNAMQWANVAAMDFHLTPGSTPALDIIPGASCADLKDADDETRPIGVGCDLGADELKRN